MYKAKVQTWKDNGDSVKEKTVNWWPVSIGEKNVDGICISLNSTESDNPTKGGNNRQILIKKSDIIRALGL